MLLSYPSGWNLDVPAGTVLVRVDVVMNTRPGAGGFCAILEAADFKENILIRGCHPETDTERLMNILALRLAEEIQGNRAVILARTQTMLQTLGSVFKPYKMIRMLGHSPLAVCDATRHAHVMAERARNTNQFDEERLMIARFEPNKEEFSENQDTKTVHSALHHIIQRVGFADLKSKTAQKAVQDLLDAAEGELVARQRSAVRKQTANDIPKPTREKEI